MAFPKNDAQWLDGIINDGPLEPLPVPKVRKRIKSFFSATTDIFILHKVKRQKKVILTGKVVFRCISLMK